MLHTSCKASSHPTKPHSHADRFGGVCLQTRKPCIRHFIALCGMLQVHQHVSNNDAARQVPLANTSLVVRT